MDEVENAGLMLSFLRAVVARRDRNLVHTGDAQAADVRTEERVGRDHEGNVGLVALQAADAPVVPVSEFSGQ